MHSSIYRTLRGIEVTEANLGYEAICEAVLGEGHFLGGDHTIAAMERDYFYPALADRDDPASWHDKGAPDAWSQARLKALEILKSHHPVYLTPQQDTAIRKQFPILL